jgi:hypothetical protein
MNRKLFLATGLIFILNGSIMIYQNTLGSIGFVLGVLILIAGIGYIVLIQMPLSRGPRIEIDPNLIYIKRGYLSQGRTIEWRMIKKVEFGEYMLKLTINNTPENIGYHAEPEVSIEIKETIIQMASEKGIAVLGR